MSGDEPHCFQQSCSDEASHHSGASGPRRHTVWDWIMVLLLWWLWLLFWLHVLIPRRRQLVDIWNIICVLCGIRNSLLFPFDVFPASALSCVTKTLLWSARVPPSECAATRQLCPPPTDVQDSTVYPPRNKQTHQKQTRRTTSDVCGKTFFISRSNGATFLRQLSWRKLSWNLVKHPNNDL